MSTPAAARSRGHRLRLAGLVAAAFVLITAPNVFAANATNINIQLPAGYSIAGTIRDSAGAVLADAGISAIGTSSYGFATTSATGNYKVIGLKAGSYQIHVSAPTDRNLRSGYYASGAHQSLRRHRRICDEGDRRTEQDGDRRQAAIRIHDQRHDHQRPVEARSPSPVSTPSAERPSPPRTPMRREIQAHRPVRRILQAVGEPRYRPVPERLVLAARTRTTSSCRRDRRRRSPSVPARPGSTSRCRTAIRSVAKSPTPVGRRLPFADVQATPRHYQSGRTPTIPAIQHHGPRARLVQDPDPTGAATNYKDGYFTSANTDHFTAPGHERHDGLGRRHRGPG